MIERIVTLIVTLLIGNLLICSAQDITESPTSTLKGAVQIELASSYESFKENNENNIAHTIGSFLALYGISDNVEMRLGIDFQHEGVRINGRKPNAVISGYTPLQIGVGADIIEEKGFLPKISVITDVFVPATGGSDFRQNNLAFGLKTVFFYKLGKQQNSQLNFNLGADFGNDELAYVYAITYLQNIGTIGGAYLELNGVLPDGFSLNNYISAAFYWTPTANIQFDTIIGAGLNADQDFYITGRLQFYIPNKKNKTTD